jgi:Tfp pilus assembly protein PilX
MNRLKKQSGVIMILSIVVMAILMTMSASLWGYTTLQVRSSRQAVTTSQVINIAEAGLDKAIYQLNQNPSYTGESNVSLGAGTFTTTVTTIDATTKQVSTTAYIPNASNPTSQVTAKINVGINSNVISFRYGVQAGSGGFTLSGGSSVDGNIYANGNINATTGVTITGSAVAANPPALAADQTNNSPTPISTCTTSNCITFGNSSATEDFAQSFQTSTDALMNSIKLYIKKVSTPGNLTVRIVTDNAGSPGSTTLLTGTLSASLVSTSFGWVTVTMPSTPILDANRTYWLVIDGASNSSRYYIIGANSTYGNGQGKIGRQSAGSWSNTTPVGLDGYFEIYLGGGYSMIGGNSYNTGVYIGTSGSGEAWAHNVMGATVTGPLYCQTSSYTNKSCNTSRADPTPQPMPLSDSNIQDWKDDAESGGVITGNYSVGYAGATLGPKKITGNVTIDGGGILTVTGTLWIEGTLTLSGGGQIRLDSSYGSNSGAIVTDGYVVINGGTSLSGSGTTGSYPFVVTTSACPVAPGCNGNNAIALSGGAGSVALVAQEGTVAINGGTSLKAVTARQITMTGGASLIYDSGLISENFNSGPGGSWEPLAGTYAIIN